MLTATEWKETWPIILAAVGLAIYVLYHFIDWVRWQFESRQRDKLTPAQRRILTEGEAPGFEVVQSPRTIHRHETD